MSGIRRSEVTGIKRPEVSGIRRSEVSGINGVGVYGTKGAEVSGIKRSEVSEIKGSEVSGIKGADLSGIKRFEVSGSEVSGIRRSEVSGIKRSEPTCQKLQLAVVIVRCVQIGVRGFAERCLVAYSFVRYWTPQQVNTRPTEVQVRRVPPCSTRSQSMQRPAGLLIHVCSPLHLSANLCKCAGTLGCALGSKHGNISWPGN